MIDPLPAYRFYVTLDPGDAHLPVAQIAQVAIWAVAGFQEVTGLGAELEVTAYSEGGLNDFVHQLPVRHSWSRISLKRGVTLLPGLWEWYRAGLAQSLGARRDGTIVLLTPDGKPTLSWNFHGGLAAKWTGPEFNAMQNNIAIEGLEIAHHGVVQTFLGSPA